MCATRPTGKYSLRQRHRQLPTIINLNVDNQVKIGLHSSDVYRCIQGSQPRSVVLELMGVSGLRVVEPALRVYTSEEYNRVFHEARGVTRVLVQKGE